MSRTQSLSESVVRTSPSAGAVPPMSAANQRQKDASRMHRGKMLMTQWSATCRSLTLLVSILIHVRKIRNEKKQAGKLTS